MLSRNISATMSNMKNIRIKPRKFVHSLILIFYLMVIIPIFFIMGVVFSTDFQHFLMGMLTMLFFVIPAVLMYVFARLFYRTYYEISTHEIIKYKGKKIIFQISKADILLLAHKKTPWTLWLFFPFVIFLCMLTESTEEMSDALSIRYKTEEDDIWLKTDKIGTLTKEEKQGGLKECADSFSRRQINKICAMLEMQPIPTTIKEYINRKNKR